MVRDGEKVILKGTVSSAAEAEQLQILLSFEPGIYQIDNQLEIKQ
jgi:osmotically-inducible protein OsmY